MHVCFGSLDFIVMTEGELAMAPIAVRHLHSAGLEVLEELQLHAPKGHVPGSDQLLGFDYGRFEP